MKTAEEKARAFMTRWNIRAEAASELATLLKEQDRDTRHACCQAVHDAYTRMDNLGQEPPCENEIAQHINNVKAV